jgi:glucosamine-phosphate N-acetyltransferase
MPLTIRELTGPDLGRGFLEALTALAEVGLSREEAAEVFRARLRAGVRTYVAVIGNQVVGTASLFVEPKFIHKGGRVGHIEDVAVHPVCRQHGVGTALVQHATEEARKLGCYKVILSCFEHVVPFYARAGYRRHDVGMRIDLQRQDPV